MNLSKSMRDQYGSISKGAGLLDSKDRGVVWVKGSDRISFLHAMISNDVKGLRTGQGRYGLFLSHTGRILCDFDFYKLDAGILIDIDVSLLSDLLEGLGKFIVMDDVGLENASADWRRLSLQGPTAGQIVEDLLQVEAPKRAFEVKSVQDHLLLINRPSLAKVGYHLLIHPESAEELVQQILSHYGYLGVRPIGGAVWEILRIEKGLPRFGVDMSSKNHPLEPGLEEAISLTKGCFVGQEAVAKAVHLGGVPKKLVKLLIEGSEVPVVGSSLLIGGKSVGIVTSATISILCGVPIALGYIKRGMARAGQQVQVGTLSDFQQATIVSSFESPE
jgi:folate-binding protein YgfZ